MLEGQQPRSGWQSARTAHTRCKCCHQNIQCGCRWDAKGPTLGSIQQACSTSGDWVQQHNHGASPALGGGPLACQLKCQPILKVAWPTSLSHCASPKNGARIEASQGVQQLSPQCHGRPNHVTSKPPSEEIWTCFVLLQALLQF